MTSPNPYAVRPVRKRLEGISPRAWEHPADRAALATMQAIPGFDELLKRVAGIFGERGVRLAFQADAVRVSPRQFPRLHRLWTEAHETLDAQEYYELYVAQSPMANAGAFGIAKPFVVLLSGSLSLLSDDEVSFIMGHELGHVLSGHALYHTMLVLLVRLLMGNFSLLGMAALPVYLALMEWYRKSELSCDRAGLLAVQLPDAAMGAMMRLAGGGSPEEMNLYDFLAQAEEYRGSTGILDQIMKVLNTVLMTHPFLVLRAALIRDWIEEGAYDRILGGEYPRRGDDPPPWRDDISAGVRHYSGGAQKAAEWAGDTAKQAGASAQGAAEGIGDAFRKILEGFERGFRSPGDNGNGGAGAGDSGSELNNINIENTDEQQ